MNDWIKLGIEPTLDASVIKKAYAKQLKLNHPEDNPEGYQELREAYDRLLKYVKDYKRNHREETLENEGDSENSIYSGWENEEHRSQNQDLEVYSDRKLHQAHTQAPNMEYSENAGDRFSSYDDRHFVRSDDADPVISEFLEKVNQIYQDFFQRLEYRNWEELLNSVIVWNLDATKIVNRKMLDFLSVNYLLPRNIWKYLNRYFEWNAQEEYIRSNYNADFANYLFLQIGNERVLRYCYFDRSLNVNYEEYVSCRESAFIALLNQDFKNAEMYLGKAAGIYSKDPDLHCLRGEFYMRTKEYKKAENEFQAALAMNANDIYIYYYKANVSYNAGLSIEALKICDRINNAGQYNYELQVLAGKCHLKMGNLKKAERIFFDNMRINPSDSELKECLEQVMSQYLLYLSKHRFALGTQMRVNKIAKELHNPIQRKGSPSDHVDVGHMFAIILSLVIIILFAVVLVMSSLGNVKMIGVIAAAVVLLVRFLVQKAWGNRRQG